MRKIDDSIIAALGEALNKAVRQYMQSAGTAQENLSLLRMNFIKKFGDDVKFLNDLSGNNDFYHRYGYLIMRNMLEQLIEFLYVQKNKHLIDEYLGLKIDIDKLKEPHTPVDGERRFGQNRYTGSRATISKMAKDIGEYQSADGAMTLYDVYCILSEKCHNSYFDSLLKDFNMVAQNEPNIGFNEEQIVLLNTMIACVLIEF